MASSSSRGADWYAANVGSLAITYACSIVTFLVAFAIISTCVRLRFDGHSHQTMDNPELVLIKNHTRIARLLSLVGVSLQVSLVLRMVEISDDDRTSFIFSLFRPVSNLCIYLLGFMTNTHAFFRLAFLLLLGEIIVTDTIAQVSVAMVINCLEIQGLRCGSTALASLSRRDLELLQLRDQLALFLNPWLVLEIAFLSLTIGICSSRYSSRRLSLSRPRFNVRAALALYFPTQFGLNGKVHRDQKKQSPNYWRV